MKCVSLWKFFKKLMLMQRFFLFMLLTIAAMACHFDNQDGSEQADLAVTEWAEAYFNCQFEKAARLVTPESRKWLRFAATNITEKDIEVLRALDAGATVILVSCEQENDTTWAAVVDVEHFLLTDSLDQGGHMADEGTFRVNVVERNQRMYVKMEGLPQNGMHNPD